MAGYPEIVVQREDGIALITLDRPGQLNAISSVLAGSLSRAVEDIGCDPAVRVLVITGAGRRFSAGADLREIGDLADGAAFAAFVQTLTTAFEAIEALPIPTVAAVNGIALGGGFELVLSCDLRVAEQSATFGLPEIALGLVPGAGGTQRLPRQLPAAVATELLMLGEPITAERAHRLGLVNQVVPDGQAVPAAMDLAATLAGRSPAALAAVKRLTRVAHSPLGIGAAIAVERSVDAALFDSPDARAGVARFLERRRPAARGE